MKNPDPTTFVKEMSQATGVSESDVMKVLEQLGLERIYPDVLEATKGADPRLSDVKIAFKIGRSTLVV